MKIKNNMNGQTVMFNIDFIFYPVEGENGVYKNITCPIDTSLIETDEDGYFDDLDLESTLQDAIEYAIKTHRLGNSYWCWFELISASPVQ